MEFFDPPTDKFLDPPVIHRPPDIQRSSRPTEYYGGDITTTTTNIILTAFVPRLPSSTGPSSTRYPMSSNNALSSFTSFFEPSRCSLQLSSYWNILIISTAPLGLDLILYFCKSTQTILYNKITSNESVNKREQPKFDWWQLISSRTFHLGLTGVDHDCSPRKHTWPTILL